MRVAHVCANLANEADGVRRVVEDIARALTERGDTQTVHGISSGARSTETWGSVKVDHCPVRGPRRFGYAPTLVRSIKAAAPDIVHAHGLWMYPALAANRAAGRRIPVVVSPHGMLAKVALGFSPRKKRLVSTLYQDRVLRHAAMFLATSEEERDDIRAFGLTQPVRVIPNGVSVPGRAELNGMLRRHTVLSLGRIHPKKGLDLLIRAWADLEHAFPYWDLRLVGPDENGHRAELEALARELGLRSVSFHEPVYGAQKRREMARASLFVLPTRSDNFALTVAESLAVETPVIATKAAPWAGLEAHDCGYWVEAESGAIRDALERAMSLPAEMRYDMGRRGRAWMKADFDWTRIAEDLHDAYRECLA